MLFIYCFDMETDETLKRYGFQRLNPASPPPFIFANNSTVELNKIESIKNRYVLTNEMVYFSRREVE